MAMVSAVVTVVSEGILYADCRSDGVNPFWYETVAFGCAAPPTSLRRSAWHEAFPGEVGFGHTLLTFGGSVNECLRERSGQQDS